MISGAGPAGSATAALFAKAGLNVLLLDRADFPRDKACGEYTSPQTEVVLARIGALEAVERAGARHLRSMQFISPGGRRFSLDYSPPGSGAAFKCWRRRVASSMQFYLSMRAMPGPKYANV